MIKSSKDSFADILFAVVMVLFIIGIIAWMLIMPHFEAREFNRCTGGDASYLTALTTELRVEECRR